jgi:hypothetical protein
MIQFQNEDVITAGIRGVRESGWGSGMAFYVHNPSSGNTFNSTFVERMRINESGYVGIGTTSPANKLEVNAGGTVSYSGNDIVFRNGNGQSALYHDSGGYVYWYSTQAITFYPGQSRSVTFATNGNVGIGTTSPAYALDVTGTIRATGDVIAYSDARVKDNVQTVENALSTITSMRGVTYTRKDSEDKSRKVGVIAQEVLPILPEVVQKDTNGNYSVAYGNIVGVLIEAIKELKAEIDILKNK